jgi:transcription antitermination factor NusG
MLSLVTQIQPLVKIRRNRCLPVSGTVLVRVGQKVTPDEILAESQIATRHIMVDVYRSLGMNTIAEAEKLINRKIGDQLDKHDIIAETGGLFSRVIRAPLPGKIVSIKNGQVLLEVETRKVIVQSGLTGQVVEILKDRGAVIETNGTLVQGVWGNGKVGFGPFVVDAKGIDEELIPSSLSITARGTVFAAAFCENEESLITAASLPVAGLVLGSMTPDMIPCALKQTYPIILLEGFGKFAINDVARKVLLANSQREMSLNAVKWDHFTGLRPEICIARVEESEPEEELTEYREGQSVRIHTSPYTGQVGMITAINTMKSSLPNGLRTATASILINNKNIVVPLSNFDIINAEKSSLG